MTKKLSTFVIFLVMFLLSLNSLAQYNSSDSTYSLHIVVDGIVDYQPGDVLYIIMHDRSGYEKWNTGIYEPIRAGWLHITDYTMEHFFTDIPKGEYSILVNVRDSSSKYIHFASEQIGFSRIDDKRTFMRYVKKYDDVQIIFPPFDSIKFSVPETKVMRIILCNPKEGIDLTIE